MYGTMDLEAQRVEEVPLLAGPDNSSLSRQLEPELRPLWSDGLWPAPKLLRKGGLNEYEYEQERETTASELFFDLVFVVACSRLGEQALEDKLGFITMLLMFWWFWGASVEYATRFGSNDLPNLVFFSWYMSAILGLVINMNLQSNLTAFLMFGLWGYAALGFAYLRVWFTPPSLLSEKFAKFTLLKLLCCAVPMLALFLLSQNNLQDYNAVRVELLFIAILQEIMVSADIVFVPCLSKGHTSSDDAMWYDRDLCCGLFKCVDIPQLPLHLEHFTERIGLFVMIVLGYTIEEIAPAEHHCSGLYAATFLSFGILTCVKILYFDSDVKDIMHHALRRHRLTGILWSGSQMGITAGIIMLGASLHSVVTSAATADPDLCEYQVELDVKRLFVTSVGVILLFLSLAGAVHYQEWHQIKMSNPGTEEYYLLVQLTRIRVFQLVMNLVATLVSFGIGVQPSGALLNALHHVTILGIFFVALLLLVVLSFLDERVKATHCLKIISSRR